MSRPKQPELREVWRQRIAQQRTSGQSVRAFCRDHNLAEHSFYTWRRLLGSKGAKPVSFALVDVEARKPPDEPIELILTTGERLRIPANASTLRLVLSALQHKPA